MRVNKSHSVAYTYLSAKTAWLSFYYPEIFMKANLNSFINNNDKIKQYIGVCKDRGIEVLPPDVNKSGQVFEVDYETKSSNGKASIRFGLKGIKSLGAKSELVIAEREANGKFLDYQDFVRRMIAIPKFDKSSIVALILAGALDEFEGSRKSKVEALAELEQLYKPEAVLVRDGQMTLLQLAEELNDVDFLEAINELNQVIISNNDEFDALDKLKSEKEYTGFYISAHPVDGYKDLFRDEDAVDISELTVEDEESEIEDSDEVADVVAETNTEVTTEVSSENITEEETKKDYVGETVTIGGIVRDIDVRYTKKDQSKMKSFIVEDDTDAIRCMLFPKKLLEGNNDELADENKIVLVVGKLVDDESFGRQILVEQIKSVDSLLSKPSKCYVNCARLFDYYGRPRDIATDIISRIKALKDDEGKMELYLVNGKHVRDCGTIRNSVATINELQKIIGKDNVSVK